jgi:PhzF family phenazine biosynthesis protein
MPASDTIHIHQVDAFTGTPFSGNPAAVCFLSEAQDPSWMQQVAREMNLSETAFLVPNDDGFDLRWFTPEVEVDLCGHATLAAAHSLWETEALDTGAPARFHTLSGLLTATKQGEWIELDFPALPDQAIAPPPGLADALGVSPTYVGQNRLDLLVEVGSEAELRALTPNLHLLRTLSTRGIIVTSRSSAEEYDFVSRFFSPAVGIAEDPVTGSAHWCLGPAWSKRLGKQDFVALQASERSGVVRVRTNGDRVALAGQAVTVIQGTLVSRPRPITA